MGTTESKTGCGQDATGATQAMGCSNTGDLMGHGAPSWIELGTSDVEAAKQFYGTLFGWTTEECNGAGMPYHTLAVKGQPRGGMFKISQECQPGMAPHWGVYIAVNDIDATAKQAEALGGKLIMPPTDIPTIGRFAVIQDPQGAIISAITHLKK